jgi:hypothetical protein
MDDNRVGPAEVLWVPVRCQTCARFGRWVVHDEPITKG